MSESVLKEWVTELPLMMQGTLMTSIRGNDLQPTPHMKPVTRWLRSLCLNNGNPENDFMDVPKLPSVEEFEDELEYLTLHYFLHFLHSLEIVGYKHPDHDTAETALDYYLRLADWCHLAPETEEEMDERLSGQPGTTGSMKRWVRRKLVLRRTESRREEPPPPMETPVAPIHSYHGRSDS